MSSGEADNGLALDVEGLSKNFGGAMALNNVSLKVKRGEVHGLLGSNGSGKSTLIKVLAGFHEPEPGASIKLYGQLLSLPISGHEVRTHGLAFVHQNLGLIPSLSVTENLYIGDFSTRSFWALNWRELYAKARATFEHFGLELDPMVEVGLLSPVERALLAIVRAYEELRHATEDHANRPGVLLLDEPTPFLPRVGVEQLFDMIHRCTITGASVIFVSHDVDEVREITDRATILRDGQLIDTVNTAKTSHSGFVERIVGHSVSVYSSRVRPIAPCVSLLTIRGLFCRETKPIDFDLKEGEILGLTGLMGSGYELVPAALYGALNDITGELTLAGQKLVLRSLNPIKALSHGIVYLPADRVAAAGVGSMSIGDNIALPVYENLKGDFGLTNRQIFSYAQEVCATAEVKPNQPQLPLDALSGGNAQKVVLSKWLQINPKVILLDEPTQGVDVGARQIIWSKLDQAASEGAGILIASSDYDQLAAICHRVLIFARGQIIGSLNDTQLTKATIAKYCYRSLSKVA